MPTAVFSTPSAVAFALAILACAFAVGAEPALYAEKYRPQFHFTAKQDWLNDPNGLVYYDGEYHLFFQRRVGMLHSDGNMTWGHAVSPDLLHWQELPDALTPDDAGSIWSGSAVVDWHNTSGFGVDGKPPLVAMYTRAKDPFSQCLAYSNDRGRTWTKFAGNPVIGNIHGTNRDPKLIWHEATKRWVVGIYLDRPHRFELFASPDLKQWTPLQTVTLDSDDECPDFFPLPVDGDATKTKWVFTAANARYIVGTFDGERFTPETDMLPAEQGPNFYAAQTYSDTPDSRRIQIGWMRRDGDYPGMPFNQQMSVPAELTLRSTPNGPRLFRWPIAEIGTLNVEKHLIGQHREYRDTPLEPDKPLLTDITGELFDITTDIGVGDARDIVLNVRGHPITYHVEGGGGAIECFGRRVALRRPSGHVRLRVLVDRTSAELFANDGETVLSCCFLPKDDAKPLSLSAAGGSAKIESLTVHDLQSAWGTH